MTLCLLQDAGTSYSGFLLKGLGVVCALTCESCFKILPRKPQSTELEPPKGWPRLSWFVSDRKSLSRPARDWQPPARLPDECTAFVEVAFHLFSFVKCSRSLAMLSYGVQINGMDSSQNPQIVILYINPTIFMNFANNTLNLFLNIIV